MEEKGPNRHREVKNLERTSSTVVKFENSLDSGFARELSHMTQPYSATWGTESCGSHTGKGVHIQDEGLFVSDM